MRFERENVRGVPFTYFLIDVDSGERVALVIQGMPDWLAFIAFLLLSLGSAFTVVMLGVGLVVSKGDLSKALLEPGYTMLLFLGGTAVIVGLVLWLRYGDNIFIFDFSNGTFKWLKRQLLNPFSKHKVWEVPFSKIKNASFDIDMYTVYRYRRRRDGFRALAEVLGLEEHRENEELYIYTLRLSLPPEAADTFPGSKLSLALVRTTDDRPLMSLVRLLEPYFHGISRTSKAHLYPPRVVPRARGNLRLPREKGKEVKTFDVDLE